MSTPEIHQKRQIDLWWDELQTIFGRIIKVGMKTIVIGIPLFLILLILINPAFRGAAKHLLMGWFYFIRRVTPSVEVNFGLVFSSLLALGLSVWLLHRAVSGGCLKYGQIAKWNFGHTLAITALTLVLFGAAIAGTGIGHQFAWLGREPMVSYSGQDRRKLGAASSLCEMLNAWAAEHEGRYPSSLRQFAPKYEEPEVIAKLSSWSAGLGHPSEPLVFLGDSLTASDPGNLPLIVSPRPFVDGRYLLALKDESVRAVSPEVYQQAMADWRAHSTRIRVPK
jgi:hypothetical protein